MSDRLYLSCWISGYNSSNMLRHFGRMLGLFPFSKLAKRGPVVRLYALEHIEPPLFEREFAPGSDANTLLEAVREFSPEDCAVEIDAFWDLWDDNGEEWKLSPVSVTLAAFGPAFDNELEDHLRIEFGLDSRFLPVSGVEGALRVGQSNIRSLLHLVEEIDRVMKPERRTLWSESGANFADVLRQTLGGINVN
ncbi:MAG TPA: hypothetical protein VMT15_06260 [Bryobacteraceae bacterium]|nr:hypothetical protein [Bryobacteraceae bacterium]